MAIDDTTPTVTVAATDASATEGGDSGTFTFTRTGPTTGTLTASFSLGGSAGLGSDYSLTPSSAVVTFAAGSATATTTVTALTDGTADAGETVALTLTSGGGLYVIGTPGGATVTLLESSSPVVTLTTVDASSVELYGNAASLTLTRSGSTAAGLDVSVAVGGTASYIADYLYEPIFPLDMDDIVSLNPDGSFTIHLGPGVASASMRMQPRYDGVPEPDETVVTTLAQGAYQIGAPNAATLTIGDRLQVVTVEATDPTATEDGTTTGAFTISRTGDTALGLTVNLALAGSATNGTDYSNLSGFVSILAGEASATVTVTPVRDGPVEGDETVVLTVTGGSYTVGTPASATVTIVDNVPVVTVTAADATATEAGSTTGTFEVFRTGDLTAGLTVNFALGGTATPLSDYQNILPFVTIPAGVAFATVTVTPVNDGEVEAPEAVTLTLSTHANYVLGEETSAAVTIVSDE